VKSTVNRHSTDHLSPDQQVTRLPAATALLLLPLGVFTLRRREIIGEHLASELLGIDIIVAELPTDEEAA
jgi:hypothetical protein